MRAFARASLLPVLIAFALLSLYIKIACLLPRHFASADLICGLSWKDGLFLTIGYSIVQLTKQLLELNSIAKRLIAALIIYSILYAIMAFPYWLSSFFQPVESNALLHVLLILVFVELLQRKLTLLNSHKP